jgi:hypothetical protein
MAGNFGFPGPEQGDDPITVALKIRGTAERLAWETRDILEDAARGAQASMFAAAPRGETEQLASHIGYDVDYRPGGGSMIDGKFHPGGGTFEAHAGVEDYGEEYPLYVYEGTGIHVGRGAIEPQRGEVMPMRGLMHPASQKQMYAAWQAGQEPQWEWVERPRREAEEHIQRELRELDAYHT